MSGTHLFLAKHVARPAIWPSLTLFLVVGAGFSILLLLAIVLWLGFYGGMPGDPAGTYTLSHYAQTLREPHTYTVLANTLWFSLSSLAVAVLFGLPAAWIV